MPEDQQGKWPQERQVVNMHVELLAGEMRMIRGDIADMKAIIKEMSAAFMKLALVEERQTNLAGALERAFKAVEKSEERLEALEKNAPANNQVTKWIETGIVAAISAAGSYLVTHAFK
jgi:hypothetical protein